MLLDTARVVGTGPRSSSVGLVRVDDGNDRSVRAADHDEETGKDDEGVESDEQPERERALLRNAETAPDVVEPHERDAGEREETAEQGSDETDAVVGVEKRAVCVSTDRLDWRSFESFALGRKMRSREKRFFDSQAVEHGDRTRDDVAEEHASGGASEPHSPMGLGAVREVVRLAEGANEDPLGRQLGGESHVSTELDSDVAMLSPLT